MAFCLDTCSLIDLRTRHYPPDLFPSLWEVIDEKASDGSLIVADEVLVEVRKKDDDLLKWLKDRSEMVIPTTEEVQGSVIEILDRFPRLVNTQKGRSQADPFVVATAIQRHEAEAVAVRDDSSCDDRNFLEQAVFALPVADNLAIPDHGAQTKRQRLLVPFVVQVEVLGQALQRERHTVAFQVLEDQRAAGNGMLVARGFPR